jgi:hypothetical protein
MPTDSASDGARCRQGLGQVCHQVAQVSTLGGPLGTGETIVNIEPGLDGSSLVKWIFV